MKIGISSAGKDLDKEFSKKIENFASENNIPILSRIAYDKRFVEALVNLKPIVVYEKKFEKMFQSILDKILKYQLPDSFSRTKRK